VISEVSLLHPLVNSPLGYHVTQLILASQPTVARKNPVFERQSLLDELGERVTWVTHLRMDFSAWRGEDCSVLLDFIPLRQLRRVHRGDRVTTVRQAIGRHQAAGSLMLSSCTALLRFAARMLLICLLYSTDSCVGRKTCCVSRTINVYE
jgi:hypothetical protein